MTKNKVLLVVLAIAALVFLVQTFESLGGGNLIAAAANVAALVVTGKTGISKYAASRY